MDRDEIKAKLRALGQKVLESDGMELIQVDLDRQRGSWLLRLTIDKPTGISLLDCQRVSEQFGAELDVEDWMAGPYVLEVSSPGLDRPLRTEADFRRFIGRLVAISTDEPVAGQRHFVGHLTAYQEGVATLVDARGAEHTIPRQRISKARLEVEF
jgi:ribosome maturation factor RimP